MAAIHHSKSMSQVVTEKDYPVQGLWILKSIIRSLLSLMILVPLFWLSRFETSKDLGAGLFVVLILVLAVLPPVMAISRRATFQYSIEQHFLTLRQGILSKQQRHIPYGVIQNLLVKQDLFDRVFGLASLTIENASHGAGAAGAPPGTRVFGLREGNQRQGQMELIGSSGNRVSIPGLTKRNTEILKGIVLQKMKENPVEDSQSGL